jgi:Fe-S oxidoreductase
MKNALCCGGSLGITNISAEQRQAIAVATLDEIGAAEADVVATACPLCKKTFKAASEDMQVADIAEIMEKSLLQPKQDKNYSAVRREVDEHIAVL